MSKEKREPWDLAGIAERAEELAHNNPGENPPVSEALCTARREKFGVEIEGLRADLGEFKRSIEKKFDEQKTTTLRRIGWGFAIATLIIGGLQSLILFLQYIQGIKP